MILQLTRDFPPRHSGGLSTAVGGIVSGLTSVGVESAVISFDGWGRKGGAGSDRLPRVESTDRVFRARHKDDVARARAWATALEPALVHVHDPMLWELGAEIAGATGAATVHTLHVLSHHQDRLRGLDRQTLTTRAQARALEAADGIIAPSPAVAAQLLEDFPAVASRVVVCRLGLELTDAATDDSQRENVALFVGRFSDMAGVDELPALLERMASGTRVSIAGGLPDNPRSARRWSEAIEDAASRSGVALDLPGWIEHDALFARYAAARVLIAPNRYATFGFTVAEAMAHGVTVCAYRVGGLVDLIEDGVSGVLVDRDLDAMATTIEELLADDRRTGVLGAAARARIASEFSIARATEELRKTYEALAP